MTMPNTKMEVEERKTNLQKASQIQLEMLGMMEISIEPSKFQALADWRYERQMQSDNVCKGWFIIGSSSQDIGEITKKPETWFTVLKYEKHLGRWLQKTSANTSLVEYRRVWREASAGVRLEIGERATTDVSLIDKIVYPFLFHWEHRAAGREVYLHNTVCWIGKESAKNPTQNSDLLCTEEVCRNDNWENNLCEYIIALTAAVFLQKIFEDPVNHINLIKLVSWKSMLYSGIRLFE